MKIFLDDKRTPPDPMYQYNTVRTYEKCVMLINAFGSALDTISLDYNIGGEHTGLDVLIYLKEKGIHPRDINIHSNHVYGAPEMFRYACENFPDSNVTMRRWD